MRAGADAVYLGSTAFSARANAANFDREALKGAVEYCHIRGVSVYLAINTLLKNTELAEALALAEYACSLPVDALIVQDAGFAHLVHKAAPGLRLHASTQMSVHTPAGAKALYEAGFSRVVLARELSLGEIKEIAASSPLELEVFVHGALCMSVSGQCYFSAMLGGRSGNRGQCAQPCRLPFSVPGGTGHDLSLKDLSAVSMLGELSAAGVTSAKIEGRMKRPEYVAAAVSACRLAADGQPVPQELLEQLRAVFSRSGFTNGYLEDKRGPSMFGFRGKEDVTGATAEVLTSLRALYKDERQGVPVDFQFTLKEQVPAGLEASDGEGHTARVSGEAAQQAVKLPLDEARCAAQLHKTGGTPYFCRNVACDIGQGLTLPVSALNSMRREALEELSCQRSVRERPLFHAVSLQYDAHIPAPGIPRVRARFPSAADVPGAARECELIYVPLATRPEELAALRGRGFRCAVEIPRGLFGTERQTENLLRRAMDAGVEEAWAGNIGAAALAKSCGMQVHGGFSLNIFNAASLAWYEQFGLADAELSFELTLKQAASIGGSLPRGLVAYGRLPLMLTRNCPAKNAGGDCKTCPKNTGLTDRRGVRFPIRCAGGCSEILNSVPLSMADKTGEMKGIDFVTLRFTVENSVESGEILTSFLQGENPDADHTRGLYFRGVE